MKSRRGPVTLIVLGALLTLGPVAGLAGTVLGMVNAFGRISQAGASASAPQLASDISLALWTTVAGIVMLPLGLILLITGIIWLGRTRANHAPPSEQPAAN